MRLSWKIDVTNPGEYFAVIAIAAKSQRARWPEPDVFECDIVKDPIYDWKSIQWPRKRTLYLPQLKPENETLETFYAEITKKTKNSSWQSWLTYEKRAKKAWWFCDARTTEQLLQSGSSIKYCQAQITYRPWLELLALAGAQFYPGSYTTWREWVRPTWLVAAIAGKYYSWGRTFEVQAVVTGDNGRTQYYKLTWSKEVNNESQN